MDQEFNLFVLEAALTEVTKQYPNTIVSSPLARDGTLDHKDMRRVARRSVPRMSVLLA